MAVLQLSMASEWSRDKAAALVVVVVVVVVAAAAAVYTYSIVSYLFVAHLRL